MRQSVKRATESVVQSPKETGSDEQQSGSQNSEEATLPNAKTKPRNSDNLDPLFVIFEQHLYNFQDSDADRKTFIGNIVVEYLTYLRKMNVVVPRSLEQPIIEELGTQVNTMLVKKIYGCLSIDDYVKGRPVTEKKKAKARYKKLKKVA